MRTAGTSLGHRAPKEIRERPLCTIRDDDAACSAGTTALFLM
jgi:hypothetical protein